MYMNQITIIGFTGQDADTRNTSNGTTMTNLSVATKESWKGGDGQWQSRTEWHRIAAFGRLAEIAANITKGAHIMVQGSLRSREYEQDGITRRIFELRADTIRRLERSTAPADDRALETEEVPF